MHHDAVPYAEGNPALRTMDTNVTCVPVASMTAICPTPFRPCMAEPTMDLYFFSHSPSLSSSSKADLPYRISRTPVPELSKSRAFMRRLKDGDFDAVVNL